MLMIVDRKVMATPSVPGTDEQISTRSVFILIGALIAVHVSAFFFWVWQLAKQSKRDKKVATD